MTGDDALLQSWATVRERPGSDAAVIGRDGEVLRTFADIEAEAIGFAEGLLNVLPPGVVLAVQTGNHPAWPALLLAALRGRLIFLPLERGISTAERDAACQVCQAAALIDPDLRLTSRSAEPIAWRGEAPVLLKLTSGTTAAPRAIRFRSAQLLADCAQICNTMGLTERDRNFGVIPVSHSYGLSNLVTPLIARGVPLVLSEERLPRAVLNDLVRTQATVFAGMPVFYQAFCELENVPPLPALRLCISAGAPLPLPVAVKFQERFGLTIHSFYGASECGGICYDRAAPLKEPGFVGGPMEGARLEWLEPATEMSQIRVHSAAVGDGYFPEPEEEKLGNGSFVPDDLLARSGDGFRIAGRVSDLINVAGKKVNPAEVEAALLRCAGVRAAIAFGRRSTLRNEEVAACVVADAGLGETDLLEFCRRRLSPWQVPKRIYFLAEMPVSERGKISRRALAEFFAEEKAPR